MRQLITVGSVFYSAKDKGWDGAPYVYSHSEIKGQLNDFDGEDFNEALEISCRIDESSIKKHEKEDLRRCLCLKTGEDQKSFNQKTKEKASFKMSQGHLVNAYLDTIEKGDVLCANDAFYGFDAGLWIHQNDRVIKKSLQEMCEYINQAYSSTFINGACEILKTKLLVDDEVFSATTNTVNCLNCEVEIDTDDEKPIIHEHTREHYHLSQLPVEHDSSATAPRFLKYLREVFDGCGDAEERIQLILEFFGYSLLTTCRLEGYIILVGDGANGKSVLLFILKKLLGSKNVCSISPSKLGERFMSAQLHGKLANIVTEVGVGEKIDDAKIKSLVSGEQQTAERKGCDHFEFHPYATIWVATNHLPRTDDSSPAMLRRTHILRFPNTFQGDNRDVNLGSRLAEELPGILSMSINAIFNALKRGGFTECPSSTFAKQAWLLESDPIPSFISSCCDVDPQLRVLSKVLYDAYTGWVGSNGVKYLLGHNEFSSRLKGAGYKLSTSGPARYISGLSLRK